MTTNAMGTPQCSDTTPTSSAPSGTEPPNTRVYRLITRPRSASGAVSWSVALLLAVTRTAKKPVTNSTGTAAQNWRTSDSETIPRQASTAAASVIDSGGRPCRSPPSVSAPDTAPTPRAAIRKPNPSASSWSTLRASSGT